MPNIGSVLREEIARVSRRALSSEVDATKKASAQHRRHIAALKRQVIELQRQVSGLERTMRTLSRAAPAEAQGKRLRFVAKGLRSHRERLGISAADLGRLLGVSAQSVYNWEREAARPRAEQLAALAALRSAGRREVRARLEHLEAKSSK